MNRGILYAAAAYLLWGFLPVFWKALQVVPAGEILGHRMVWSLVFVAGLLTVQWQWAWLRPALRNRRVMLTYTVTGLVLSINWLTYIWGVNNGFVVETSLGYFINPLVNVVLGVVFLRERLRVGQWTAVALAVIGVVYLTINYGSPPWIALTLAFSFGTYGLLRKTGSLNSLEGLTLETAVIFPFAFLWLGWLTLSGQGHFGSGDWTTSLLLLAGGVVTAVPLLLFASGARRIPLSVVGILQYIAPTIQFLLGVFLYNEPFTRARLIGFSFIWLGLAVYSTESLLVYRAGRKRLPHTPIA